MIICKPLCALLTLGDAISDAIEEESVNGMTGQYTQPLETSRAVRTSLRRLYTKPLICQKCGKTGHRGEECRTSRYATRFVLLRPEQRPRINATSKYCNHCYRIGHSREECRRLQAELAYSACKKFYLQHITRRSATRKAINK